MDTIKKIVKDRGLKLVFKNIGGYRGYLDYKNKKLIVNGDLSKRDLISLVFHELGHLYCYNNKKYKSFHVVGDLTEIEKKTRVLTAWKAEKYVDDWGEKEMKKYYPKLKYIKAFMVCEKNKIYVRNLYKHLMCGLSLTEFEESPNNPYNH
jgi:hypothetical protein